MGLGYQHPQQLLLPADPASSFSQFWALWRVAWGHYLTQETTSGQRVAAGGVCGPWHTQGLPPMLVTVWATVATAALPLLAAVLGVTMVACRDTEGPGRAALAHLTSPEPLPEGKVGTSGRKGLPGLGASCAESEQERETRELRSRGRCRFGAAKWHRSPWPAPSAPFFCPQGLGFTGWGCQCPGLLLPSGF